MNFSKRNICRFLLVIFIIWGASFAFGSDSRYTPVRATYCDNSTMDIYPYSFVTRGNGSTFNCYEVQSSSISGGMRYGFEDGSDSDYNDVIIDLWVTGNNTDSPTAHVKFVSKDAEYKHWIYIVYNGSEQLAFKSEQASPGAVYDFPLPSRTCPGFDVQTEPNLRSINQGESTFYTSTIKTVGGFSNPVNLSVSGLPTGATYSFDKNPLPVTSESKLTIETSKTTPTGTYTLTITGTSGALSDTTTVTLEINERPPDPDFSIEATPSLQEITQGQSTSYNIDLTSLYGFNNNVQLSVTGLPTGANGIFSVNPVTLGTVPSSVVSTPESVLNITTSLTTPAGTYTLTITGQGGSLSHSTQVTLKVNAKPPDPDFSINATPSSREITQGESTSFTVNLTALNSFNTNVTVSATGLPTGAAGTFTVNPVSLSSTGQTIYNITTALTTAAGTYKLTFTGEGGDKTHSTDVTLKINVKPPDPDFGLQITPSTQNIKQGETASYTIGIVEVNGFSQAVSLSITGVPEGANASFVKNPLTPGNETELKIVTTSQTPNGTYRLVIAGEGGTKRHTREFSLTVGCRDFSIGINASSTTGPIPLPVQFEPVITITGDYNLSDFKFKWEFGDGESSTEQKPVHTFSKQGTYTVTLTVTDSCNSTRTASTQIEAGAFDGTLTKAFSQSQAAPGDTIYITISAVNRSGFDFSNITITDSLSPYLEFIDEMSPVPAQRSGQDLKWQIPSLKKDETISLKLKVKISSNAPDGTISNIAYMIHESLEQGKSIPSNTAVVTVKRVETVDISLSKSVDKTTAKPGDTVEYRLNIKNSAAVALTGIIITDELANELVFGSSVNAGRFTFSNQGRNLEWKGSLDAGEETHLVFNARVGEDVLSGSRIPNKAVLTTSGKAITSNTVETTISSDPIVPTRVYFTKKADVPQVQVGRIIHFNLTVRNDSNSALLSPAISDYLPQGFNYVAGSAMIDGQQIPNPTGTRTLNWELSNMLPNETHTIRYQVVIGTDVARGKNITKAILHTKDNSGQDVMVEASDFVNVASDSFIFYSSVDGTVYLDRDNDEFYSMADTPLPGIEVTMSNGMKTTTDNIGHFTFESLFPGEYAVAVNRATLPEKYRVEYLASKLMVLSDGLSDTVDFGIKFKSDEEKKTAKIDGRVFYDKNQDKKLDSIDALVTDFKAILDGKEMTRGSNGIFTFTRIEPGKHTIEIQYDKRSIIQNVLLSEGDNKIEIPLPFTGIKIIIRSQQ